MHYIHELYIMLGKVQMPYKGGSDAGDQMRCETSSP